MRNRGYRFIIRNLGIQGVKCVLCINSTWINQLMAEAGVDVQVFRKISWMDLYEIQSSERMRSVMDDLRPKNFWQMCDAVAFRYIKYCHGRQEIYNEPWFKRYPILALEDVYEILLEEGFGQKEALEITDFFEEQNGKSDKTDLRDFLELYDVPTELSKALLLYRFIPPREKVIRELVHELSVVAAKIPVKTKQP